MAKRGYKLQEFLAHSTNVNCLSIGKKTSRLLITGGEDYKVNLWAIGKPTSLMSLCGHTSPVDSVAFDSAEVLVLAGASSGVIKLWDLEEAKMVRALTGHRSNCSAVEFHPFGEFFASGSMDTNLKIWDIRKKGCIHTYKGHSRGINTIRFTPDGRWVVSGGLDNVVKVWDLTAGKLLHDFKFHEGHIRSIDFHPLEFLLATGSADGTVKFWDLETFELIGSSRPEVTGVRSITFHPDGRTLFCGLDDSLKIYSWEPVVCHDGVDMGWSTLGDLCINEGKILGCSHYRNSVGIWVADISLIEPYGVVPTDKNEHMEKRFSLPSDQSSDRGSCTRRCITPDYEAKEIKNIYVDSSGGNSTAAPKPGSLITPNVLLPLKSEKASNVASEKQNARFAGQAWDESFIEPSFVPRESDNKEDFSVSGRESITFSRTKPGMLLRPAHVRKTPTKSDETKQSAIQKKSGSDSEKEPNTKNVLHLDEKERKPCDGEDSTIKSLAHKFEKALSPEPPADGANCMLLKPPHVRRSPKTKYSEARQAPSVVSGLLNDKKFELEQTRHIDLQAGHVMENRGRKPCEEDINVKNVACRFESPLSPETQSGELKSQESPSGSSESNSVKVVRGVTVVSGRTRSLVERFEKRETFTGIEDKTVGASSNQLTNIVQEEPHNKSTQQACTAPSQVMHMALNQPINTTSDEPPSISTRRARSTPARVMPVVLSQSTNKKSVEPPVTLTRSARASPARLVMPVILNQASNPTSDEPLVTSTRSARASPARVMPVILDQANSSTSDEPSAMSTQSSEASLAQVLPVMLNQANNLTFDEPRITYKKQPNSTTPTHVMPLMFNPATSLTSDELGGTSALPSSCIPTQNEEPQISGRENDIDITENLMQTHNAFLSTLQSRLTKLQIVRHFWDRRDIKGAIGALKKLPDHSVQADVIGILMDKKQILTLDVFSLLLPVLTGLLGSNTERPANVSLEMLLKLVAVFNPVVRSTISAPGVVGVDLHAEQRFELCNSCFSELQKVQKILPELTRRGGLLARKAQELNLVLQQA